MGPVGRNPSLWIGRLLIRPTRRYRTDRIRVDLKQKPLPVPIVALSNDHELAAGERMERVGYPNKICSCVVTGRITL